MTNKIVVTTPAGNIAMESAEIEDGDNMLNITTPGGQISYKSGTISSGNDLLVVTTPAGLVAVTDGSSDSTTGSNGGSGGSGGSGGGFTFNGKQVSCIQITAGFVKSATPPGVSTDLGSLTFGWDGTGRVFIASGCQANPDNDLIWTDDKITVTNSKTGKQVSQIDAPWPGTGGPYGNSSEGCANSHDLEITNILQAGDNTIDTVISDLYGNIYGCCALYIIQVADSDSPNTQNNNGMNVVGVDPEMPPQ